jgi:hypothetical protein
MIIDFMPVAAWTDWVERYGENSLYNMDPEGRSANMLLNIERVA